MEEVLPGGVNSDLMDLFVPPENGRKHAVKSGKDVDKKTMGGYNEVN